MSEIAVHPVDNATEHDAIHLDLFLRVRVLDIATGQPVTDAYAIRPEVDPRTMKRLAMHPFRIKEKRDIELVWVDKKFKKDARGRTVLDKEEKKGCVVKFKTLRTCIADPPSVVPPKKFVWTWKCVPEFFHGKPRGTSVLDGKGNVYEPVHGDDKTFVCVKKEGKVLAERSLITNVDGILEIPVSMQDLFDGKEVVIEFRDYCCALAEGPFSPEVGHKTIGVSLDSSPNDNNWVMKAGGGTRKFEKTLTHKPRFHPLFGLMDWVDRAKIDLTLWVVRKVKECDSEARTLSSGPRADYKNVTVERRGRRVTKRVPAKIYPPRGIIIHYNSGYYISEKRGEGAKALTKVFNDHENDYMLWSETALQILKALRPSGKGSRSGYHYHIERNGQIVRVVDEELLTGHAGTSREKKTVGAEENVNPGKTPRRTAKTIASPVDGVDKEYIGIDMIGHDANEKHHFTEPQLWYLDRLIENIQARRPEVKWYYIQGHDEVVEAWNDEHVEDQRTPKNDPGAALHGGMDRLRGRHGATFP